MQTSSSSCVAYDCRTKISWTRLIKDNHISPSQCFEEMELWPLLNRAKVEAAHAEDLVKEAMLRQIADEEVQRLGNLVRRFLDLHRYRRQSDLFASFRLHSPALSRLGRSAAADPSDAYS